MPRKLIPDRTRRFLLSSALVLLTAACFLLDQAPGTTTAPNPNRSARDTGTLRDWPRTETDEDVVDGKRSRQSPAPSAATNRSKSASDSDSDSDSNFTISPEARAAIAALQNAKRTRTPGQIKLNARLIHAAQMLTSDSAAPGVGRLRTDLQFDSSGRVLVDIRGSGPAQWPAHIESAGGSVVVNSPRDGHLRAWMPLGGLDQFAMLETIREIRPASRGATGSGSVRSAGDQLHRADITRAYFGASGEGITVGVLSDSVDFLEAAQLSGDLDMVTVLPGQSGAGKGEGTAMLEIIHDLAPAAQLFFATAIDGPGGFARNIRSLRQAGCDILVDDFEFDDESPFQDDIIARAVNEVTEDGAIYVSLAGNSGNLDQATSGTWEGDFADSSQALPGLTPESGRIHDFGGGAIFNIATDGVGAAKVNLFWADPLAAAVNDYDIFILDPSGTQVRAAGNTTQNGSQDPYESLGSIQPGERVVIVLFSGAPRFLHLDTFRGGLSIGTNGRIRGHSCASRAICVAAVDARTAGPSSSAIDLKTQRFSSDGPRRMFFDPDGESITPGNWSATGGAVRLKPEVTAADAVQTTVAEFNPFIGTSAAAPHAAAIAALLLSRDPAPDADRVRSTLIASALDMQEPGWDENSGAGLVNAYAAAEQFAAERRVATLKLAEQVPGSGFIELLVVLDAAGNENALSFTLDFDPGQLRFVEAAAGPDVPSSASFFANSSGASPGRVGLVLAVAPGDRMAAGEQGVLRLRFRPVVITTATVNLAFSFADTTVPRQTADVLANSIHTAFEDAVVPYRRPPVPPDILFLRPLAGGEVQLRALGQPGERYVIEISDDLDSWTEVTEILSTSDTFEYIDSAGGQTAGSRFYRTRTAAP